MKRTRFACAVLAMLGISSIVRATEVAVCTDKGSFTIELDDAQAPSQTANFLRHVEQGFYSGAGFHRVAKGIIVQSGGHDRQLGEFLINLADNERAQATQPESVVFGRVTSGLDVLDEIGKLPTAAAVPLATEVPEPLVAVSSMAVIDRAVLGAIPGDTPAHVIQERICAHAEVAQVFAACEIPPVPALPNGSLDSLETMTRGQAAVSDFMSESNLYLDCVSQAVDGHEHTQAQRLSANERHNRMVTLMERLAEEFNRQVRVFKAREE